MNVRDGESLTSSSCAAGSARWTHYFLAALLALVIGSSCASATHLPEDAESGALQAHPGGYKEIVAHRGANLIAPENTLAAAQACIDRNVDYLEVDVRTSKDGVFYVLHDRTLDRTTNGTGAIGDSLSSYIDTLDAGSWFGAGFEGEPVPRLEPFLKELRGKIKIYFDVKNADLNKLVDLVYATGFERNSFFWFSDDSKATELRRIDKSLNLKITAQSVEALERALAYDPQIIECRLEALTPEFVALCRKQGLKIMVNSLKTNPEQDYPKIIRSPADMVNLDDVDLMVDLMERSRR